MLKYLVIGVMFPVLAILFTKYLGEEYAWINRKIIHFSSVPAILFFREGLVTGKELAAVVMLFAVGQLLTHLMNKELSWYQIKNNYGEVFYCIMFSAMALFMDVNYASAIMLVMAVSDGITGVLRYYYFRKNGFNVKLRKHWIGSVGYIVSAIIIAFLILPQLNVLMKVAWSVILMLAEYQKVIDDNVAVPVVAVLIKPLFLT
ncbi:hypothetical protein E3E31_02670 [Thermococcus sp. M39]|uniref:hypothetical protein n=1 Tax=unclassified Thermococcus TaxID=2627626 RepID=UPI001439EF86|nr:MULTISPECIES: hypothetical protein [unclassified Thermococcus]NJE07447.1 hypothetical protein [Thermococcus sp. M39]NJE12421.1 hypothetical protein [Thermococcus sp. LS2]